MWKLDVAVTTYVSICIVLRILHCFAFRIICFLMMWKLAVAVATYVSSNVTKAEYSTRDDVTKAEYGTRDDVTFYTVYPSHKTYPCQNPRICDCFPWLSRWRPSCSPDDAFIIIHNDVSVIGLLQVNVTVVECVC
jgi:hypothetical protein